MACGYLSQASFSRDFLARYGERPSRVQRRFRDRRRLERLGGAFSPSPFSGDPPTT
jgi:AraC-like DNA-binding protein